MNGIKICQREIIMTFEPWEEKTNKVIANNLVDNISSLLDAKVIRQTVVNSRGEVKQRIIIEYEGSVL